MAGPLGPRPSAPALPPCDRRILDRCGCRPRLRTRFRGLDVLFSNTGIRSAIAPITEYHREVPARTEFAARFMPKLVLLMPTLVLMTLAAGFQLALLGGNLAPSSPNHAWLVVSFCVVGVMAVIALGVLEPANIAVLVEPDG